MSRINHKQTIHYLNLIFVKCRKSKLQLEQDKELKDAFKHLSNILHLTPNQCVLFAIVFVFTVDEDVERVKTLRMLHHLALELEDLYDIKEDIEYLIKSGYVKQKKEDNTDNLYNSSFVVNQKLLDLIFRNEAIIVEELSSKFDFPQFAGQMTMINRFKLVNRRSREDILRLITEHEDRNEHLNQIQIFKEMGLDVKDRFMIYYLTHCTYNQKQEVTAYSLAFDIDGIANSGALISKLKQGTTKPQFYGLIEVIKNEVLLTTKAKAMIMVDSSEQNGEEGNETSHYYIKHEVIPDKKLYFNNDIQRELSILNTLLQKDNFIEYQNAMKQNGNKAEGISILLYGPSGTGKSSIAEQLARVTQRNILQVDMSAIRSRWYGESEKGIKRIFDEYESICSKVGNTPILLLNECDALLCKRNNAGEDRHDQTEAVMTNLLLEHFEKNKGIIIGITNLVENLDPAFMRRFTMKYLIDKPDKKAVKSILKSKLDFLTDREIGWIADSHSLTGGQIENVSQKCVISKIITKSNPTVSEVMDYCETEKIKSNPWKLEEY
jgi:energy-coupling factor transporter ATP-binding protein EcfA2